MDRLLIDADIENIAQQYQTNFRALGIDVPGKLRNLKKSLMECNTKNKLTKDVLKQYCGYLERVAQQYDDADKTKHLLILKPDEFEDYTSKYNNDFPEVKTGKSLYWHYKKKKGKRLYGVPKPFWQLVVDCMHYEKYVRPIIIPLLEKLNIRACVYCNVQYALTINHNKGLFELDHRYPKSKYPFLCTSFYNLQPSCPSCNHGKKAATADFGLYTTKSNELHPFHLLTLTTPYLYERNFEKDKLAINLVAQDPHNLEACTACSKHEHDFDIDNVYSMLKDVAEETIWRCKAYDETYRDLFCKNFPELYSRDALYRFVFGAYSDESNVHKRPLTKLIRDIVEDMKVVIKI